MTQPAPNTLGGSKWITEPHTIVSLVMLAVLFMSVLFILPFCPQLRFEFRLTSNRQIEFSYFSYELASGLGSVAMAGTNAQLRLTGWSVPGYEHGDEWVTTGEMLSLNITISYDSRVLTQSVLNVTDGGLYSFKAVYLPFRLDTYMPFVIEFTLGNNQPILLTIFPVEAHPIESQP